MDLVDLARAALENDTPGTLKSINAGQEPFVDPAKPQLHPMVYDMNVKLVANPDPDVSGQSMKGKPDAVGKLLRDEIVAGALDRGSGWVTYVYAQPGKAGLFQKAAYYKLSEGSDGKLHAVCAGRYLGPFAGTPSPGATAAAAPTQAEVQTFVKKALAYAQENGKAAALKAFAAPGGEFHQGELYVYAYDFNGTVIANGGDPALVGANRWDYRDATGKYVVRELIDVARDPGSGWVDYEYANPTQEGAVQPKTSYVRGIDGAWPIAAETFRPQE